MVAFGSFGSFSAIMVALGSGFFVSVFIVFGSDLPGVYSTMRYDDY